MVKEHKHNVERPEVIQATMHHGIKDEKNIRGVSSRLVVILSVLVVIALVAALSSWRYASEKPKDNVALLSRTQLVAVLDEVDKRVSQGDQNEALQILENNKDKVSSNDDRADLYRRLAQVLFDAKRYEEALEAAQIANDALEIAGGHGLIGDIAAANQNWRLAAEAYGKAAAMSDKTDNPMENSPYNEYKHKEKEAAGRL